VRNFVGSRTINLVHNHGIQLEREQHGRYPITQPIEKRLVPTGGLQCHTAGLIDGKKILSQREIVNVELLHLPHHLWGGRTVEKKEKHGD